MRDGIPAAFLQPVINTRWKTDEYSLGKFAWALKHHAHMDYKCGSTAVYAFGSDILSDDRFTSEEFNAMRDKIPEDFTTGEGLNQHYCHSLEQFCSQVQKAWNEHVERTEAIRGTPAGRCPR